MNKVLDSHVLAIGYDFMKFYSIHSFIIEMGGKFINSSMIDFVNIEISLKGIHCYNILDFLT